MTTSISWLSFMTKKFTIERYIQKCTPPSVLILIMASELLKLIEWFKISIYIYIYTYIYIYIYQEKNMTFPWHAKIFKLGLKDYFFRSCHYLVEVTFSAMLCGKLKLFFNSWITATCNKVVYMCAKEQQSPVVIKALWWWLGGHAILRY